MGISTKIHSTLLNAKSHYDKRDGSEQLFTRGTERNRSILNPSSEIPAKAERTPKKNGHRSDTKIAERNADRSKRVHTPPSKRSTSRDRIVETVREPKQPKVETKPTTTTPTALIEKRKIQRETPLIEITKATLTQNIKSMSSTASHMQNSIESGFLKWRVETITLQIGTIVGGLTSALHQKILPAVSITLIFSIIGSFTAGTVISIATLNPSAFLGGIASAIVLREFHEGFKELSETLSELTQNLYNRVKERCSEMSSRLQAIQHIDLAAHIATNATHVQTMQATLNEFLTFQDVIDNPSYTEALIQTQNELNTLLIQEKTMRSLLDQLTAATATSESNPTSKNLINPLLAQRKEVLDLLRKINETSTQYSNSIFEAMRQLEIAEALLPQQPKSEPSTEPHIAPNPHRTILFHFHLFLNTLHRATQSTLQLAAETYHNIEESALSAVK